MRRTKKFSEGGRAAARRDRRMADIESDYKKALARGVSEKEARAKRAQRIADTQDDYAKHTGADRTQTRAAEKAAESRLSAARRSPDKDMKPVSVTSEGPATKKVDTTQMAQTPKVETAPTKKAEAPRKKPTARSAQVRPAKARTTAAKPTVNMAALRKLEAEVTRPSKARTAAAKPESVGKSMIRRSAQRQQSQVDELGATAKKVGDAVSWFFSGKNRDEKAYARGGKIDGIAIRGKTRLKRKK